jgi:hypothetical protein
MYWRSDTIRPSNLGSAEIVLPLTTVILLLRPLGNWTIRPFILALAALAIISPAILRAPATWYAMSLLVGLHIAAEWPLPDNHIYLLAYWCLAVGLALNAQQGATIISQSSRLLIGFSFLMAVVWKAFLSGDYLDGRFFSFTFFTDGRFEDATMLFGGLTKDQLIASREFFFPLPEGAEWLDEDEPGLADSASFRHFVMVSTWGMLVLEALIALAHLVPLPERVSFLRHGLLLGFCMIVYAFAPVAGFGWLLLTMGIANCHSHQFCLRIVYVAVWALLLLYDEVPWAALLLERLRQ